MAGNEFSLGAEVVTDSSLRAATVVKNSSVSPVATSRSRNIFAGHLQWRCRQRRNPASRGLAISGILSRMCRSSPLNAGKVEVSFSFYSKMIYLPVPSIQTFTVHRTSDVTVPDQLKVFRIFFLAINVRCDSARDTAKEQTPTSRVGTHKDTFKYSFDMKSCRTESTNINLPVEAQHHPRAECCLVSAKLSDRAIDRICQPTGQPGQTCILQPSKIKSKKRKKKKNPHHKMECKKYIHIDHCVHCTSILAIPNS
ncbi:uncharacterized protein IWZ02DRAFT_517337 [Phyllosticta citriasiana]|uniref:uncharacterized protein n=1 Tax=Phyllosticta citriasiana TaxID=595635 RepID=UPI0030FD93AB